ncbi:MAG: DUF6163 family protein [Pseudolabrys sp.]|jgi:hypothetical protein
MSEPFIGEPMDGIDTLEPVHEGEGKTEAGLWTRRLVLFLRVMAGVSMLKGLYHWSWLCGIGVGRDQLFQVHSVAWQTATVFFAVIDLVAAVGLWLAAAWGAVIWLMSIASMLAVDMFFPQVFGGGWLIAIADGVLLALYLWLALKAAQEQPA